MNRRSFLTALLGTATAAVLPIPAQPGDGIALNSMAHPDLSAWYLGPAIRAKSTQMAYALQRVHQDQMAKWGLLNNSFTVEPIPYLWKEPA